MSNEPDIVISIRYNDIFKIRQSEIGHEDLVTNRIEQLMRDLEKEIKGLTTEIVEIDSDKQKAIDIGYGILQLINEKAQEKVDEIRICRG